MTSLSDKKTKIGRAPKRKLRKTDRWSLHDMPTMPPQVVLPDQETVEVSPDKTSLLPAPPLDTSESFDKVTVYLNQRMSNYLKNLTALIRSKSGIYINQSEVLRAMADAIMDSGVDLSDATCEADVKRLLGEQLR